MLIPILMWYHSQIALGRHDPVFIRDYAVVEAMVAGVDDQVVQHILKHETGFNPKSPDGDMKIICPRGVNKGKPVRARGVASITQCYHPEVSDEQAYDTIFAVNWLINEIKKGNCEREFSTCPTRMKTLSMSS